MAASVSMVKSSSSRAASTLYRSLLKAHKRHLPLAMKELGDAYVKSEFKLHRTTAKPEQAQRFLAEWENYLQQILQTARAQDVSRTGGMDDDVSNDAQSSSHASAAAVYTFGKDLPPEVELTEAQLTQLEKLRDETTKSSSKLK